MFVALRIQNLPPEFLGWNYTGLFHIVPQSKVVGMTFCGRPMAEKTVASFDREGILHSD
jgi:hypothetical protein